MLRIIPQVRRAAKRLEVGAGWGLGRVTWIVVGLHVALTTFLAWRLNIWVDEAYSLHTSGAGPVFAFQQALRFELQPPLYFVGLAMWRAVSAAVFWARVPSVLCTAAAIPLTVVVGRRLIPSVPPAAIALAIAFNPVVLEVAVDIRLYAFAFLLSVLLLLLFWDGYVGPDDGRWYRAAYVAVSVGALYTQYYLGFLLLANGLVLIALRRRRDVWRYLVGMLVVSACFSPMGWVPFRQAAAVTRTITAHTSVLGSVRELYARVAGYLLPDYGVVPTLVRHILRALVLAGGGVAVWRLRLFRRPGYVALFTLTAVLCASFIWVLSLAGASLTTNRHTVVLFAPLVLGVLGLADAMGPRWLRDAWVGMVLLFGLAGAWTVYSPMAKTGDWERVAAHVMRAEKPGQPIAVFLASGALPLRQDHAGSNTIVALPHERNYAAYDVRDYALESEESVRAVLDQALAGRTDVWLITAGRTQYLDVDFHGEMLARVVARCYETVSDRRFFESRVRLLKKVPACRGS